MNKIISVSLKAILCLAILDVMILSMTVMQIAEGEPTPHIPFWDAQIAFVANL